jgi:glycosidase
MEFENNSSWGYNPTFYFAPDKFYGPADDLKRLVDTCHSMGIAIIFDIVLNHSFGQSPMVQLYWDTDSARPAQNSPWFNPVPKHDYNVGYDFNHESPFTKLFVSQVTKFWLTEYKADGFRFDLSKGFTQKNNLGKVSAWGAYDASRIAILKTIADTIWKVNSKAFVILEHFADNSEEKELVNYGMMVWGNLNPKYRDAAMGWNENDKTDFSGGSYKNRGFSNPGLVTYMESHDEDRIVYSNLTWANTANASYPIKGNLSNSLVRAELVAAFFFTYPGPKLMWQFGEMGYDFDINLNGRTGEKPIHWEYMINNNRFRLWSIYKELINLRNSEEAFSASSDYTINSKNSVKVISINHSSMDIRIVGNFDLYPKQADASFSKTGWWYDYFSGDSLNVTDIHQLINLDISEYRIYTTKRFKKPDIITSLKKSNYDNSSISYYPNPCRNDLKISILGSRSTPQVLEIVDLTGRLVKSIPVQSDQKELKLEIGYLTDGLYFVGFKGESKNKLFKLK